MQTLVALGLLLTMAPQQDDRADWMRCPDAALVRARETGKPILLYLYDR